jgi:hypothetical protein
MVGGCQTLSPPNTAATLQADNQAIVQEATMIAESLAADRQRIETTADASMTQVAVLNQDNLVLLATVRAGDPPEQRVVSNAGAVSVTLSPGQRWFSKTGVSKFINDADGCVIAPQIRFPMDSPIIYATLRAFNVESGVELSASWSREGTEAHRESFVLSQNWSEICIWFSIEPPGVELLPGSWTVQMFANGAPLEGPMAFTIEEGEAMMEG